MAMRQPINQNDKYTGPHFVGEEKSILQMAAEDSLRLWQDEIRKREIIEAELMAARIENRRLIAKIKAVGVYLKSLDVVEMWELRAGIDKAIKGLSDE